MRNRLLRVGRTLFAEKGFAETGTPEIVRAADVTRGALYHHFTDKTDLFRAVVEAEAAELADGIEAASRASPGEDGMIPGVRAFFRGMAVPGRTRLLLVDGPAVLGRDVMDSIDAGAGRASLHAGLRAMRPDLPETELTALAKVLSAGFDRAAQEISDGDDPDPYLAAFALLFKGIA